MFVSTIQIPSTTSPQSPQAKLQGERKVEREGQSLHSRFALPESGDHEGLNEPSTVKAAQSLQVKVRVPDEPLPGG